MKQHVKNSDYCVVEKWMVKELGLAGRELQLYALIYTSTKSEKGEFDGSLNYIVEWLRSSRQTAINVVNTLLSKKLISKRQIEIDGIKHNYYKAVLPYPKR